MLKTFLWSTYFNKRERIILFLLLLIGLILRIITAYFIPLWRDEVYAFFLLKNNSFINILTQKHWDTCHPPLFFSIMYFWTKFGYNNFFLRIPSLFFTAVSFYLLPILAKKIHANLKHFPFILMIPFLFSHTQESLNIVFKNYPLAIFFSLLSLIIFFDLIRIRDFISKEYIISSLLFGLVNFLLFFTLYGGFYLIISYFVFFVVAFFFLKRKSVESYYLYFSPLLFTTVLVNLVIIFYLTPGYSNCSNMIAADGPITISKIPYYFYFFTGVTSYDFLTKGNQFLLIKSVFIITLSLLGIFIIYKKRKLEGLYFFILLISSFLIFSILAYMTKINITKDRTLYVINIVFLIGLSYFLAHLFNKKTLIIKLITVFFILILIIDFFEKFPFLHYVDPPYDFKKLHEYLRSLPNGENKLLITHAPLHMFEHLKYYDLFQPIKNYQLLKLESDEIFFYKNSKENILLYANFLFGEDGENFIFKTESKKLDFIKGCKDLKRIKLSYIYLVRCLN